MPEKWGMNPVGGGVTVLANWPEGIWWEIKQVACFYMTMHNTKGSHFPHLPYAQCFQGFALTKVQTFAHKCTQTFQTCTKKDPPLTHTFWDIYAHFCMNWKGHAHAHAQTALRAAYEYLTVASLWAWSLPVIVK